MRLHFLLSPLLKATLIHMQFGVFPADPKNAPNHVFEKEKPLPKKLSFERQMNEFQKFPLIKKGGGGDEYKLSPGI